MAPLSASSHPSCPASSSTLRITLRCLPDRPDNNFMAALSRRAGWGFFDPGPGAGGGLAPGNYADGYQNVPVNWSVNTPRKRAFFDLLRQVTGA